MNLRKRCLDLEESARTTRPLPLNAIYLLSRRVPAGPVCEFSDLKPAEALGALMTNRLCTLLLDREAHARDMATLTRLTGQVPISTVTRRDALDAVNLIAQTLMLRLRSPAASQAE